eukprot:g6093.t1
MKTVNILIILFITTLPFLFGQSPTPAQPTLSKTPKSKILTPDEECQSFYDRGVERECTGATTARCTGTDKLDCEKIAGCTFDAATELPPCRYACSRLSRDACQNSFNSAAKGKGGKCVYTVSRKDSNVGVCRDVRALVSVRSTKLTVGTEVYQKDKCSKKDTYPKDCRENLTEETCPEDNCAWAGMVEAETSEFRCICHWKATWDATLKKCSKKSNGEMYTEGCLPKCEANFKSEDEGKKTIEDRCKLIVDNNTITYVGKANKTAVVDVGTEYKLPLSLFRHKDEVWSRSNPNAPFTKIGVVESVDVNPTVKYGEVNATNPEGFKMRILLDAVLQTIPSGTELRAYKSPCQKPCYIDSTKNTCVLHQCSVGGGFEHGKKETCFSESSNAEEVVCDYSIGARGEVIPIFRNESGQVPYGGRVDVYRNSPGAKSVSRVMIEMKGEKCAMMNATECANNATICKFVNGECKPIFLYGDVHFLASDPLFIAGDETAESVEIAAVQNIHYADVSQCHTSFCSGIPKQCSDAYFRTNPDACKRQEGCLFSSRGNEMCTSECVERPFIGCENLNSDESKRCPAWRLAFSVEDDVGNRHSQRPRDFIKKGDTVEQRSTCASSCYRFSPDPKFLSCPKGCLVDQTQCDELKDETNCVGKNLCEWKEGSCQSHSNMSIIDFYSCRPEGNISTDHCSKNFIKGHPETCNAEDGCTFYRGAKGVVSGFLQWKRDKFQSKIVSAMPPAPMKFKIVVTVTKGEFAISSTFKVDEFKSTVTRTSLTAAPSEGPVAMLIRNGYVRRESQCFGFKLSTEPNGGKATCPDSSCVYIPANASLGVSESCIPKITNVNEMAFGNEKTHPKVKYCKIGSTECVPVTIRSSNSGIVEIGREGNAVPFEVSNIARMTSYKEDSTFAFSAYNQRPLPDEIHSMENTRNDFCQREFSTCTSKSPSRCVFSVSNLIQEGSSICSKKSGCVYTPFLVKCVEVCAKGFDESNLSSCAKNSERADRFNNGLCEIKEVTTPVKDVDGNPRKVKKCLADCKKSFENTNAFSSPKTSFCEILRSSSTTKEDCETNLNFWLPEADSAKCLWEKAGCLKAGHRWGHTKCVDMSIKTKTRCIAEKNTNVWISNSCIVKKDETACTGFNLKWAGSCIDENINSQSSCSGATREWVPGNCEYKYFSDLLQRKEKPSDTEVCAAFLPGSKCSTIKDKTVCENIDTCSWGTSSRTYVGQRVSQCYPKTCSETYCMYDAGTDSCTPNLCPANWGCQFVSSKQAKVSFAGCVPSQCPFETCVYEAGGKCSTKSTFGSRKVASNAPSCKVPVFYQLKGRSFVKNHCFEAEGCLMDEEKPTCKPSGFDCSNSQGSRTFTKGYGEIAFQRGYHSENSFLKAHHSCPADQCIYKDDETVCPKDLCDYSRVDTCKPKIDCAAEFLAPKCCREDGEANACSTDDPCMQHFAKHNIWKGGNADEAVIQNQNAMELITARSACPTRIDFIGADGNSTNYRCKLHNVTVSDATGAMSPQCPKNHCTFIPRASPDAESCTPKTGKTDTCYDGFNPTGDLTSSSCSANFLPGFVDENGENPTCPKEHCIHQRVAKCVNKYTDCENSFTNMRPETCNAEKCIYRRGIPSCIAKKCNTGSTVDFETVAAFKPGDKASCASALCEYAPKPCQYSPEIKEKKGRSEVSESCDEVCHCVKGGEIMGHDISDDNKIDEQNVQAGGEGGRRSLQSNAECPAGFRKDCGISCIERDNITQPSDCECQENFVEGNKATCDPEKCDFEGGEEKCTIKKDIHTCKGFVRGDARSCPTAVCDYVAAKAKDAQGPAVEESCMPRGKVIGFDPKDTACTATFQKNSPCLSHKTETDCATATDCQWRKSIGTVEDVCVPNTCNLTKCMYNKKNDSCRPKSCPSQTCIFDAANNTCTPMKEFLRPEACPVKECHYDSKGSTFQFCITRCAYNFKLARNKGVDTQYAVSEGVAKSATSIKVKLDKDNHNIGVEQDMVDEDATDSDREWKVGDEIYLVGMDKVVGVVSSLTMQDDVLEEINTASFGLAVDIAKGAHLFKVTRKSGCPVDKCSLTDKSRKCVLKGVCRARTCSGHWMSKGECPSEFCKKTRSLQKGPAIQESCVVKSGGDADKCKTFVKYQKDSCDINNCIYTAGRTAIETMDLLQESVSQKCLAKPKVVENMCKSKKEDQCAPPADKPCQIDNCDPNFCVRFPGNVGMCKPMDDSNFPTSCKLADGNEPTKANDCPPGCKYVISKERCEPKCKFTAKVDARCPYNPKSFHALGKCTANYRNFKDTKIAEISKASCSPGETWTTPYVGKRNDGSYYHCPVNANGVPPEYVRVGDSTVTRNLKKYAVCLAIDAQNASSMATCQLMFQPLLPGDASQRESCSAAAGCEFVECIPLGCKHVDHVAAAAVPGAEESCRSRCDLTFRFEFPDDTCEFGPTCIGKEHETCGAKTCLQVCSKFAKDGKLTASDCTGVHNKCIYSEGSTAEPLDSKAKCEAVAGGKWKSSGVCLDPSQDSDLFDSTYSSKISCASAGGKWDKVRICSFKTKEACEDTSGGAWVEKVGCKDYGSATFPRTPGKCVERGGEILEVMKCVFGTKHDCENVGNASMKWVVVEGCVLSSAKTCIQAGGKWQKERGAANFSPLEADMYDLYIEHGGTCMPEVCVLSEFLDGNKTCFENECSHDKSPTVEDCNGVCEIVSDTGKTSLTCETKFERKVPFTLKKYIEKEGDVDCKGSDDSCNSILCESKNGTCKPRRAKIEKCIPNKDLLSARNNYEGLSIKCNERFVPGKPETCVHGDCTTSSCDYLACDYVPLDTIAIKESCETTCIPKFGNDASDCTTCDQAKCNIVSCGSCVPKAGVSADECKLHSYQSKNDCDVLKCNFISCSYKAATFSCDSRVPEVGKSCADEFAKAGTTSKQCQETIGEEACKALGCAFTRGREPTECHHVCDVSQTILDASIPCHKFYSGEPCDGTKCDLIEASCSKKCPTFDYTNTTDASKASRECAACGAGYELNGTNCVYKRCERYNEIQFIRSKQKNDDGTYKGLYKFAPPRFLCPLECTFKEKSCEPKKTVTVCPADKCHYHYKIEEGKSGIKSTSGLCTPKSCDVTKCKYSKFMKAKADTCVSKHVSSCTGKGETECRVDNSCNWYVNTSDKASGDATISSDVADDNSANNQGTPSPAPGTCVSICLGVAQGGKFQDKSTCFEEYCTFTSGHLGNTESCSELKCNTSIQGLSRDVARKKCIEESPVCVWNPVKESHSCEGSICLRKEEIDCGKIFQEKKTCNYAFCRSLSGSGQNDTKCSKHIILSDEDIINSNHLSGLAEAAKKRYEERKSAERKKFDEKMKETKGREVVSVTNGGLVNDVLECFDGYSDSDENKTNGCELAIDIETREACPVVQNGTCDTCKNGVCSEVLCTFGYVDADENPGNGCEVEILCPSESCFIQMSNCKKLEEKPHKCESTKALIEKENDNCDKLCDEEKCKSYTRKTCAHFWDNPRSCDKYNCIFTKYEIEEPGQEAQNETCNYLEIPEEINWKELKVARFSVEILIACLSLLFSTLLLICGIFDIKIPGLQFSEEKFMAKSKNNPLYGGNSTDDKLDTLQDTMDTMEGLSGVQLQDIKSKKNPIAEAIRSYSSTSVQSVAPALDVGDDKVGVGKAVASGVASPIKKNASETKETAKKGSILFPQPPTLASTTRPALRHSRARPVAAAVASPAARAPRPGFGGRGIPIGGRKDAPKSSSLHDVLHNRKAPRPAVGRGHRPPRSPRGAAPSNSGVRPVHTVRPAVGRGHRPARSPRGAAPS